jgi:hypothetical protein
LKFKIEYVQVMRSEVERPTIEDAVAHTRLVIAEFPENDVKLLSIIPVLDT